MYESYSDIGRKNAEAISIIKGALKAFRVIARYQMKRCSVGAFRPTDMKFFDVRSNLPFLRRSLADGVYVVCLDFERDHLSRVDMLVRSLRAFGYRAEHSGDWREPITVTLDLSTKNGSSRELLESAA